MFVFIFQDLENSWLEADRPVGLAVRLAVPVRETHLDHEGEGANSEAPVCGLRHREAPAHRQLHERKLQPPGPTVSPHTSRTCHFIVEQTDQMLTPFLSAD